MFHRHQIIVTSITAVGVWLNLFNNVKMRNEYTIIKNNKKDAGGTRSDQSGTRPQ